MDLMMCDYVIKTGVHCDQHGTLYKVFRLHDCQSSNTQRISFLINTHNIGWINTKKLAQTYRQLSECFHH